MHSQNSNYNGNIVTPSTNREPIINVQVSQEKGTPLLQPPSERTWSKCAYFMN